MIVQVSAGQPVRGSKDELSLIQLVYFQFETWDFVVAVSTPNHPGLLLSGLVRG